MSNKSTLIEKLKASVNDLIDRLLGLPIENEEFEYASGDIPPEKLDVKLHLSIKIK